MTAEILLKVRLNTMPVILTCSLFFCNIIICALLVVIFNENFEFENYFRILEDKDIYSLCKFRTTNHK